MAFEGSMLDPGRYQALQEAYQKFTLEHEALVRRSAQGSEPTVAATDALVHQVDQLRKSLQQAPMATFKDYLCTEKPFFPLAYRLSQLIAMPLTQCDDLLKLSMSRAVHGLLDLAVLQCDVQERRIYEETVKEIKGNLRNVIKTVPDSEGETEINLKFAHAASKKLEEGKGKWRTLISNHRMPFAEGLAQVLLSVSPLPPFISLGALAPPVMHLIRDIYNAQTEKWYAHISTVIWYSDLGKINNFEDYSDLKQGLVKPSENYKFAFFLTDLFGRMLKDERLDLNLRDEIINGEGVSLVALFDRNISVNNVLDWRNKRKFWRVRYNCLKQLELADVGNPAITEKIWKRM